ncbi:MAG: hypothetical protein U1C12_00180 [Patescibacteria group bacterium]|nr:hypothetical protein [Patescibacteria group bacterium]
MADDKAKAVKEDNQEPTDPAPEEAKAEPEAPKETESAPIDWEEDEDKPKEKPKAEPKAKPKTEEPKEEEETEDKPEEKSEELVEETKSEEKPTKADERKTQLNTEIRDLVSKRNALKEEIEKANAEAYAPADEKELLDQKNPDTGENYTSVEAKVEALRQSTEMDKYNTRVADAQLTIESESQRVINDFPMFNKDNESFDKELSDEAAELLRANLILDENTGQVIGSNVSPYQLYKTIARAAGVSAAKGQIKGQAAAEKMMANADVSTNAAPPAKPKDPLMDILVNWDEP